MQNKVRIYAGTTITKYKSLAKNTLNDTKKNHKTLNNNS